MSANSGFRLDKSGGGEEFTALTQLFGTFGDTRFTARVISGFGTWMSKELGDWLFLVTTATYLSFQFHINAVYRVKESGRYRSRTPGSR